jgi:hypothetical protein
MTAVWLALALEVARFGWATGCELAENGSSNPKAPPEKKDLLSLLGKGIMGVCLYQNRNDSALVGRRASTYRSLSPRGDAGTRALPGQTLFRSRRDGGSTGGCEPRHSVPVLGSTGGCGHD